MQAEVHGFVECDGEQTETYRCLEYPNRLILSMPTRPELSGGKKSPSQYEPTRDAHFDQRLQVVIMSIVVEGTHRAITIAREDVLKGPRTSPQERKISEDS